MNFTLIERPFSNVVVPKCCSLADAPSAKNKSAKSCIFNIGLVASDFKLKLRKKIFFPLTCPCRAKYTFFLSRSLPLCCLLSFPIRPSDRWTGEEPRAIFFSCLLNPFFHIFTRYFNLMGNRTHFIYVLSSDFLMLKLV